MGKEGLGICSLPSTMAAVTASRGPSTVCHVSLCCTKVVTHPFGWIGQPSLSVFRRM